MREIEATASAEPTRPAPYSTRGASNRCAIRATAPATMVPSCVGTPVSNARTRSRRWAGIVLTRASHVLPAPPLLQAICAKRNAARGTHVADGGEKGRRPAPRAWRFGGGWPFGNEPPRHGGGSAHQRGPDEEQVLRSKCCGEGACDEAAHDEANDASGCDQREEPLCLPGVRDEAGEPPDREETGELGDALQDPECAVHPGGLCLEGCAPYQGGDGDRSRDDDEHALAPDPREERADTRGGQEHCDADDEVKRRELLDAVAGEEERVDAALGDHDRRVGKKGNGHGQGERP